MRTPAITAVILAQLLLFSCKPSPTEGSQPGQCSDAADNDLDGLFDCNDPDCFGSPDCQGADDDDSAGDDDDSASSAGPCRPIDHLWDPATEPMR